MKRLIINPKKEQISRDTVVLDFAKVFNVLMSKVYNQEGPSRFNKVVTQGGHISRFVGNVEPTRKSIQDYSGKEINTYAEGVAYLHKIGGEIYDDKQWPYKLIMNEVKFGRAQEFVMETDNEDLIEKITKSLDGFALVEYNKIVKPKNKKTVAVTDTEAEITTNTQDVQENSNE